MHGHILMKLITATHYQIHTIGLRDSFKVGCSRSRSGSDGRRHLVNPMAPGPLKRFELKLTSYLL